VAALEGVARNSDLTNRRKSLRKSLEMRAKTLRSGFCEKSSALMSVRLPGFLFPVTEREARAALPSSARRHNLVSVPEVTAVDDFYLWHAKRREGIGIPEKEVGD
jgi:hypothetical protein